MLVDQNHDWVVRIVHGERLESPRKRHRHRLNKYVNARNTKKPTSMENNHKLKAKLQKVLSISSYRIPGKLSGICTLQFFHPCIQVQLSGKKKSSSECTPQFTKNTAQACLDALVY